MKKTIIALFILLALCLTACHQTPQPTQPPSTDPVVTQPTDPPTEPPTNPPTDPPTQPPHSALYIPGLEADDVILYFNEVCLDAEFINGGDATKLQKWVNPISYRVHGEPTDADLAVLEDFAAWLNTIEGFPGIKEEEQGFLANLNIHFCDQQELLEIMGSNFTGLDGAVTFWYMDNEIYDAVVCVRTDLDQELRNSVILEEIYNGLGPVQDTDLRPDSIIYSAFTQPQSLTEVDELLMKLLYSPEMKCGMDAEECAEVIRKLYY